MCEYGHLCMKNQFNDRKLFKKLRTIGCAETDTTQWLERQSRNICIYDNTAKVKTPLEALREPRCSVRAHPMPIIQISDKRFDQPYIRVLAVLSKYSLDRSRNQSLCFRSRQPSFSIIPQGILKVPV